MSRYRLHIALAVLAASALLGACGREGPTAVGGALLPGGSLHTFEVVLDAPQFLVADTSVVGFVRPSSTLFEVVAQSFRDSVFAHTLARFNPVPASVTVLDSSGTSRVDTLAKWFGGRVVLMLDTTAANGTVPVQLQLFRTAEAWDGYSATWTMRVDSGSTHVAWRTPGGTTAGLVDTATWTPGADSVVLHVDSATVAAWSDTTNLARGALVAAATGNSRLRFTDVHFTALAHSTIRKDTTVAVNPGTVSSTFIYTPTPRFTPGQILLGGDPAWRSFLTIAPDLETRLMSCPPSSGTNCTFTLKRATVNFAGLMLQAAPAGGFAPEDSVRVGAWVSDTAAGLPLTRAPLGTQVGGTAPAYAPGLFAGTPSATVTVPLTIFAAALAGDTTHSGSAASATRRIALLQIPEPGLFGVARFWGRNAPPALAPRLRLVVTIATEAQLP